MVLCLSLAMLVVYMHVCKHVHLETLSMKTEKQRCPNLYGINIWGSNDIACRWISIQACIQIVSTVQHRLSRHLCQGGHAAIQHG